MPQEESYNFAIITLLLYWFFWPAGLVCNIIGLSKGPQRGCFVWMGVVFIALPVVAAVVVLVVAILLAVVSSA
jgi:hypothetical protein